MVLVPQFRHSTRIASVGAQYRVDMHAHVAHQTVRFPQITRGKKAVEENDVPLDFCRVFVTYMLLEIRQRCIENHPCGRKLPANQG
jgi:hypothetical protein